MAVATSSEPLPHRGLGFPAFVLMIAMLQALGALGVDSMLPNLPAIGLTYALPTQNQRQLIVTAYLLGFGGAQIIYGSLADRYGRKPVLLGGLAVYVLFSAVAAFSPTFQLLVVARGLQGVGAAATRVLPLSIVRDCYAGRQMARVMSLAFLVFMAVPMLAPSVGTAVAVFASWRWVFGVLTVVGAAVLLAVWLKLPETLHPEDRIPIVPARLAAAFGQALRSRQGMGYAAAMVFIMGALFGFVNSVEQIFEDVFHRPSLFPLVFAIVAGGIAVGSLLNARLVGRIGMRPLSHAAILGFIALSMLHAAVAATGRESLITFTILQAATMFTFGLISGNFGAMAMEPLGHVAGAAASLQGSMSMFGGSIIGFFIGQAFNGSLLPIPLGYAICGVGALVCVLFAERGRLFRPTPRPTVP